MIHKKRGIRFIKTPEMWRSLTDLLEQSFPSSDPHEIIETMVGTTQYYILDRDRIVSILSYKRFGAMRNDMVYPHVIYNVATHPMYRGAGYMTSIFKRLIAERPRTKYHLEVFTKNPAVGFYQRMGFEVVDKITRPRPSSFIMRLQKK